MDSLNLIINNFRKENIYNYIKKIYFTRTNKKFFHNNIKIL